MQKTLIIMGAWHERQHLQWERRPIGNFFQPAMREYGASDFDRAILPLGPEEIDVLLEAHCVASSR